MKHLIFAVMFASLLITGCGTDSNNQYIYQAPENLDDGVDVGMLDEVNVDSSLLGKAVERIRAGKYGEVHSLLIFKDGKLVFEEYFPGHMFHYESPKYHGSLVHWRPDSRHNIMSAGKSITSACISIAIEEGFIESVDQSIFDYLPDYQHLATDGKDQISIEHLLTMTSGLEWDEWGASNSDINNNLIRLWVDCDDQVACVLGRRLVNEPGTAFTYTGGGMIVLGEIIANATGMDIEAFANQYLFAPMDIDSIEWKRFDNGVIYAGGEQMLSSREMLKFGITYLNNGEWNSQQVIPEEWVSMSAVPYGNNLRIRVPGSDGGRKGYGYSWWTWETKHNGEQLKTYYAGGWGGQRLFVISELDTVVVMTGGNYTSKTHTFTIMEKYVLPAFN